MTTPFHPAATSWLWMRSLLDAAGDGILVEHGERVLYANDAFAKLLRYRRSSDVIHKPVASLIAAEDADRLLRFGRTRVAGENAPDSYNFAARCADGSSIRLQASVSMAVSGGKAYIMTIVRPFPASGQPVAGGPIAGPHDTLSGRERLIMEYVLAGKRPKAIALELGVSEKTVATLRARVLVKIGAADNRELFQYALRHRLIDWT